MPDLGSLRGKYNGHIYLVGNGPNLVVEDIRGDSFGMNLIARGFLVTRWRPTFYVCFDRFVLDRFVIDVSRAIGGSKYAFLPSDVTSYTHENIVPVILKDKQEVDDITEGLEKGGATTMMPALKLAHFMGFTDVTLVGCDFYTGGQLHFYEPYNDTMAELSKEEISRRRLRLIESHYHMIQFAKQNGMGFRYA